VSDIIRQLLDGDLVEEGGQRTSHVGRRPTLVSLKANGRHVIGVQLGGALIRGLVTDLHANILHWEEAPTKTHSKTPIENLFDFVDDLVARAQKPLLGIGIAAPGLVDAVRGDIRFAAYFRWRDIPLRHMLQQRYGVPIYVDKDTNLAALSECTFGAAQGSSPLAFVMLDTGIGAGLVIDGQVYAGVDGGSGEIGHLIVVTEGELCTCGRRGCLETVASVWGLIAQAERLAADHPESALNRPARNGGLGLEDLQRACASGDALAAGLVCSAGYHLGVALAALVHVFNPRHIVIGGKVAQLGSPLLESARQGLRDCALPDLVAGTDVVPSSLGEKVGALGAVSLVLSKELGLF
jgi:glucokinase-like ROK family protein